MIDIKIDLEFSTLIPPPSNDELAGLESSLQAEGCRDPLVVWKTDGGTILVDGHNRYAICSKHDIAFNTVEREFASRDTAKLWILDNQLSRRNLTPFARTELVLKKKEILAGPAREQKLSGKGTDGSGGRGKKKTSGMNSSHRFQHRTREAIAQAADVSEQTVQRVETLLDKAPAPIIEKLRKGKVSIHDAYKNLPRKSNGKSNGVWDDKDAANKYRLEQARQLISDFAIGKSNGHKKGQPFRDLDDFAIRVSRRIGTILTQDDSDQKLVKDLNALERNANEIKHGKPPLVQAFEFLEHRAGVMKQRFLEAGIEELISEITSDEESADRSPEVTPRELKVKTEMKDAQPRTISVAVTTSGSERSRQE